MPYHAIAPVGIVVIGRNEGERLHRCLRSVVSSSPTVVYVDSGSTDGSPDLARKLDVHLVDLDLSKPFFTAARARNAGFVRLRAISPEAEFVFFIDGDCEMRPDFLTKAMDVLLASSETAIVAGRLRERFPGFGLQSALQIWNGTRRRGDVDEVGGIFVMRVSAFIQLGGIQWRDHCGGRAGSMLPSAAGGMADRANRHRNGMA